MDKIEKLLKQIEEAAVGLKENPQVFSSMGGRCRAGNRILSCVSEIRENLAPVAPLPQPPAPTPEPPEDKEELVPIIPPPGPLNGPVKTQGKKPKPKPKPRKQSG